MKVIVGCLFLIFTVAMVGPATGTEEAPNLEEILGKIKKVYAKKCCFQAAFKQLTVNVAMDITDRFRGIIYVKKPGTIALKVHYPESQEVVMKGRSYSVHFPADGNTVNGEAPPGLNIESFFGFFTDIGSLDENFIAKFPSRAQSDKENVYFIELTDRKNPRTTHRVQLGIDRDSFIIKSAIIYDALGNYNRFDLSGTTFVDSMPESTFKVPDGRETQGPAPRLRLKRGSAPK